MSLGEFNPIIIEPSIHQRSCQFVVYNFIFRKSQSLTICKTSNVPQKNDGKIVLQVLKTSKSMLTAGKLSELYEKESCIINKIGS